MTVDIVQEGGGEVQAFLLDPNFVYVQIEIHSFFCVIWNPVYNWVWQINTELVTTGKLSLVFPGLATIEYNYILCNKFVFLKMFKADYTVPDCINEARVVAVIKIWTSTYDFPFWCLHNYIMVWSYFGGQRIMTKYRCAIFMDGHHNTGMSCGPRLSKHP